MRIDLQRARVRPVGSSGIAHRTNAGFVMVGTADSRNVLSIIEQHAAQSNLVELVIAELSVAAPEAFCFLFVSQGELYALTCGSAVISLTTATGHTFIEPLPQQVLIQRIDLGVGDSDGRLVLYQKGTTVDQVDGLDSVVDLQSGTVLADALDLTISRMTDPSAEAAPAGDPMPLATDSPAVESAVDSIEPGPGLAGATTGDTSLTGPAPATASTAISTAATGVATDGITVLDEPINVAAAAPTPAAAAAESSLPPPPPPAADQIMFAEDIDEISGSVDAIATPTPIDKPVIKAPVIEAPVLDVPSPASMVALAGVPSVPPSLASTPPSQGAFSGVLSRTSEAPAPAPAAAAAAENGAVEVPPAATSVGPVMVLGVACPDGHHNHPEATECSECAARIGEHHTTVLMNGPRPPLGVLMADDGKTWSLASDIVIGREPATHEDVAGGTATSMALTDDTLSLSRHHARISLDDWSAYIIDLGSSNGTYLNRNRSAQEWSPVPSDMALPLEPGDRLRVGSRIIQVELYQFDAE